MGRFRRGNRWSGDIEGKIVIGINPPAPFSKGELISGYLIDGVEDSLDMNIY